MKAQRCDDGETSMNPNHDAQDQSLPRLNNKLERRRRIEDLHEERKLQKELYEF